MEIALRVAVVGTAASEMESDGPGHLFIDDSLAGCDDGFFGAFSRKDSERTLEFRQLGRGLPAPGDVVVGADEQCTVLINGTQRSPGVEHRCVDPDTDRRHVGDAKGVAPYFVGSETEQHGPIQRDEIKG